MSRWVLGLVVVALAVAVFFLTRGPGDSTDTTTAAPIPEACGPPAFDLPSDAGQLVEVAAFISDFVIADYRTVRHDNVYTIAQCWHDWTTDGCSGPIGDKGPAFNFGHPCHRHDFGYRNYKRLEELADEDFWNEETKLVVDDQFLEDLRDHCSSRAFYEKHLCLAWSQVYYLAVRAFGGWRDPLL